jgi:hypothetical protein
MIDAVEARRQLDELAAIKQDLDKSQKHARMAGGYPDAVLLTDGHAFWVESWKRQGQGYTPPMIISLRCETPVGAWKSCCEYLDAR